jgi:hypothetical protein
MSHKKWLAPARLFNRFLYPDETLKFIWDYLNPVNRAIFVDPSFYQTIVLGDKPVAINPPLFVIMFEAIIFGELFYILCPLWSS